MLLVAIGWELYERTASAFALGLVGLVQVLPVILLALPAGHIADAHDRRKIVALSQSTMAAAAGGLLLVSATHGPIWLIYACLLAIGVARAFNDPAASALLPSTVPISAFANAATWSSSSWQLAVVSGPAVSGAMIALFKQTAPVYAANTVACLIFAILVLLIKGRPVKRETERASFKTMTSGLGFIWRDKVILASITLDMVAVLLGSAGALLPVFAKDILHAGPEGLGLLRAAPSIGALLMALFLAHRGTFRRAGLTLLWSVVGFGLATIVFGFSQSFVLSLLMLGTLGALDNISVVIRSTLLLTRTPDHMRGRVSAVNSVFVGLSNELGAFESGVAAGLFGSFVGPISGAVLAVASGGIGTILVVGAVALIWPEIRKLRRLDDPAPATSSTVSDAGDVVQPGTITATGD